MRKTIPQKMFFATNAILAWMVFATPVQALELNRGADNAAPEATDVPLAPPQFARVIDDLPLPPGLKPVDPDEDVLFVVPRQGRIADTTAAGKVDIDEIYHFYQRSLPQLGWQQMDARTFQREGEILRIRAIAENQITTVHFSVEPEGAAQGK